jgi:flagellar hook-associated protein 1
MNAITIGVAALAAGQRGLAVTGQNIANATTPGYRRQGLTLASRQTAGEASGVDVVRIARFEAPPLRAAILRGNSEEAALSARLDVQSQIESALGEAPNDIGGTLGRFFDGLDRLSSRPDDIAARREFLASADQLASRFNSAAADIGQLRGDLRRQIGQGVQDVNEITANIAKLNGSIYQTEVRGESANELRDQRDQLVDDLSKIVDFRVVELPYGVVNLLSKDQALVVSEVSTPIAPTIDADGAFQFQAGDTGRPISFSGGALAGLQEEYNVRIPRTLDRLDTLANSIAKEFDRLQATGLGLKGPRTQAVGTRAVVDPTAPLATQALDLPLQNGRLTLAITDAATGARSNVSVAIDPATQSLNDVAASLDAASGGRVAVGVDSGTNVLRFQAQPGFAFDFAGRVATAPTTNILTGTATPTLDGAYAGTGDESFTFTAVGSGTVGSSSGLQLEVRNGANQLVKTLDVGAGYVPGTPLALGNGLTVALGAGTVTGGSFTADATGAPDTTGLLAGLGVGGLFTGTGAIGLRVRPEIEADPALLATSRNGLPGDAANLQRFAALRNQPIGTGGLAPGAEATDIASEVGTQIRSLDNRRTAQATIVQNLFAQEQAIVGVDVNEEIVKLLDYQRMIESAARYMSVVNEALDEIVRLVQ